MPRVKRYADAAYPPAADLQAGILEAIERDRHAARALDLEAAQRIQEIRRQAAATHGFDAETAAGSAHQAIAETRAEFAGRARSPRMRAMLEEVLERRAALADDELTAHVERARSKASLDAAQQRRRLAQQDAVDAFTPLAFQTHLQTMLDAIGEHGQLAGIDPAEVAADLLRAASSVHADRTASLIELGDIEGAIAARDANREMLTGTDAARLDALLAEPIARAASNSRVDRIMGARTRDGDTAFSYADPLHGAGRTSLTDTDGTTLAIPAAEGTPVYPTAPGSAARDGEGALIVTHADGSQTRYAGLGDVRPGDGEQVTPDTLLGTLAGGAAPQLRYAMWRGGAAVDPTQLAAGTSDSPPDHLALLDATAAQAGESYGFAERLRDEAELARRLDPLDFATDEDAWVDTTFDGNPSPAMPGMESPPALKSVGHMFGQTQQDPFDEPYPEAKPRPPRHLPSIESGNRMPSPPTAPPLPRTPDGSGRHGRAGPPTEADRRAARSLAGWADRAEFAGLPNAARHLRHFLGNSGEPLVPDMKAVMKDRGILEKASGLYRSDVLADAATEISRRKDTRGSLQVATPWTNAKANTWDLYYAMGTLSISVTAVVAYKRTADGKYLLTVTSDLNVFDRYNWDRGKSVPIVGRDEDRGRLHEVGTAREYEIRGSTRLTSYSYVYDPTTNKIYYSATGKPVPGVFPK